MDDFQHLDHYELLGVGRSASAEEIKRAYRQQVTRFHPDHYVGATPEELQYVQLRTQRLNEAYAVLSDFAARNTYNRSQARASSSRVGQPHREEATPPSTPRDVQGDLYAQAQAHLSHGRVIQAVAILRQLQQINPFYRDAAQILASAEEALHQQQSAAALPANQSRRRLLVGGFAGVAALGAVAAGWWWQSRATAWGGVATAVPPLDTTVALALATETALAPSPLPLATETAVPTTPPTATPVPATPTPVPTEGTVLFSDSLVGTSRFFQDTGAGWSVGYSGTGYQIRANQGVGIIWSYITGPRKDMLSISVECSVQGGAAGLLFRFSDAANNLVFLYNPSTGRYRLEQYNADQFATLASGEVTTRTTTNRISVQIRGNQVGLLLNDQFLQAVEVSAPPLSNRIGLVAIGEEGNAIATFRDLNIHEVGSR